MRRPDDIPLTNRQRDMILGVIAMPVAFAGAASGNLAAFGFALGAQVVAIAHTWRTRDA